MTFRLEEQAASRLGNTTWLVVARFDTEREARLAMQHRQRTQGRNHRPMRVVGE